MTIAKRLINTLMIVVVTMFITLQIAPQGISSVDAHPSQHPVAFAIAAATYRQVDNDDYLWIWRNVRSQHNGVPGDVVVHAAYDICHNRGGTLYEDFSCSK